MAGVGPHAALCAESRRSTKLYRPPPQVGWAIRRVPFRFARSCPPAHLTFWDVVAAAVRRRRSRANGPAATPNVYAAAARRCGDGRTWCPPVLPAWRAAAAAAAGRGWQPAAVSLCRHAAGARQQAAHAAITWGPAAAAGRAAPAAPRRPAAAAASRHAFWCAAAQQPAVWRRGSNPRPHGRAGGGRSSL